MVHLAGFLGRRRRWVIGGWVLIVAVSLPLASHQTDRLTGGGFDVPGSQSRAVSLAVQHDFGAYANGLGVLWHARPGESRPHSRAAAIARVQHQVASVAGLTLSNADARRARTQLARSGVGIAPLRSRQSSDALVDSADTLRPRLRSGVTQAGVTTYLIGQPAIWAGIQELSKEDLAKAEAVGFPLVALILLAVFGSLAAAVLPLVMGFFSVTVTGALVYLISQQMTTSIFVTNVASMIGIGVAIDYSLFILARYREERQRGRSQHDARAEALATSGLAVTFSGLAVIVALAGLLMIDNQALRSMAIGAMTVVAISILTATTLLPPLIAALGDRVQRGGVVARVIAAGRRLLARVAPTRESRAREAFWDRWTTRVMARPWLSVAAVSGVLLVLAMPVLSLTLTTEALRQLPDDSDVRIGNALASRRLGGGTDPIQIVARFGRQAAVDREARALVAGFARNVRQTPGVRAVAPPAYVGRGVLIQVTPRASSESRAATALIDLLRNEVVPRSALSGRAAVAVGGEAARMRDLRAQVSGSMWKIVGFVLALSFVVLTLMLRSVLLPLKAVVMNLMSIAAAFGVLVAIFEWGWLDGLLGFESLGSLDTVNVPLILVVVFGLSMDYEVFLLSRIRERYLSHGDNRRAVAEGLTSSAGTISSAALVMTTVFAVFVLTGVTTIKELGVGCAVAIALDATLVRLVLVPATMQLMDRWNWWLPAWLDRALPDLSFDAHAASEAPAEQPVETPAGV